MGCRHGLKDKDENTAMHLAAKHGQSDALNKLVEMGLDVDEVNIDGLTALHFAAEGGHTLCVRFLIESDCNINALTKRHRTALHFAAERGCEREACLLIDAGIDCDAVDNQSNSALHLAVSNNHTEVARVLVDAGCNLDLTDNQTPLHIAAELGSQDLAEMMLISGVNLNLTDKQGMSCADVASRGNHVVLVDMIIKADRFYKWEKEHSSEPDSCLCRPLSFRPDRSSDTQHIRSVLWTLATRRLCRGEWLLLAQLWGFTDAHLRNIQHQWTGMQSYKEHGHRMLLIWLHGALMKRENPVKGLYEGLVGIHRKDLAESVRQKANADSPKKCIAM
uniref:Death domain-containing protein n=1 Tax=Knipowitschia caucasica TaxID=637954 RepID=A0AAV2LLH5_KNICA